MEHVQNQVCFITNHYKGDKMLKEFYKKISGDEPSDNLGYSFYELRKKKDLSEGEKSLVTKIAFFLFLNKIQKAEGEVRRYENTKK